MPTVTAADFLERTEDLSAQVMRQPSDPVLVRQGRKSTVVLLDAKYYQGLLETMEILSDPDAMDLIRQARQEIASGKVVSHDEVMKEFGIHGTRRRRNRLGVQRIGKSSGAGKPRNAAKNRRKG